MIRQSLMCLVAATACLALAGAADASAVFYGLANNGDVVRVDVDNLTSSVVANMGFRPGFSRNDGNSLAINAAGDQLYLRSPNNDSNLSLLDLNTSTVTDLGNAVPAVTSNAAWYNGSYWTIGDRDPVLYKVNLDAAGTSVVDTQSFAIDPAIDYTWGDIAIDNNGVLYGASSSTGTAFFKIDLSTGAPTDYTPIGSLGLALQIAFDSTGTTLYGHHFNTGNWYTIDTATGALSQIKYGNGDDFTTARLRDLAGAVVPEPSSVAMTSLAGLLGLGLAARRRFARA